jgi:hypothetical protein
MANTQFSGVITRVCSAGRSGSGYNLSATMIGKSGARRLAAREDHR